MESFVCLNCSFENEPLKSGTRNHCRHCLCSRHVDRDVPGDRESDCLGIMQPFSVFQKNGELVLEQRCERCGKVWKNKLSQDDNMEVVIKIFEEKGKNAKFD